MKKLTFCLVLILSFCVGFGQEKPKESKHFGKIIAESSLTPSGHIRCVSSEYEQFLQENNPKRMTEQQFEEWLAPLVEQYKQQQQVNSESGGIIYIPVVVHVIHNGDAYGTNENITDEQVESQMTVMTQDFRKMVGTPGYNSDPVGADVNIEFVLAKVDPNGNPTNGINRVNLCQTSWSTGDVNAIVKPTTIWDPTLYMNMWSVNFTSSSLLGYAQFPSNSGLSGLNANGGNANTDGVVAGYRYFGSSSLAPGGAYSAPFDKGRTMTHEVGHYLGLRHIWGDGGCTVDDYCADTPVAGGANGGCPTNADSCPSSSGYDMVENYMDYTNDACMNIFTNDQKARIITVMNNSPRRVTLKTSTKDLPITLFPNDAEVLIENICSEDPTCTNQEPASPNKVISLYNRGNSNLTSAVISYNIDGGTTYTYNYSGNLAPNKFVYITLSNTNMNGTLNTTITSANGTTDQRASNNTASKTFGSSSSSIDDYAYTTFHMTLIEDDYGVETTWELTNSAGTVVYSGGPYTSDGSGQGGNTVYDADWTLVPDCYTFTIYDEYGDGICCSYGNGSYTITTNSGATTVKAGGNFTSSETVLFTNTSLNTNNFTLETIASYPNPTSDILNVSIPIELGSTISYEIYNNLGQTVKKDQSNQNNFTINTSDLNSGIYFVKLQIESTSKVIRFIKQ